MEPHKPSNKNINYKKLLKDLNIRSKFVPLFAPLQLIKIPSHQSRWPFVINLGNNL
jgi:hypothetical protein